MLQFNAFFHTWKYHKFEREILIFTSIPAVLDQEVQGTRKNDREKKISNP